MNKSQELVEKSKQTELVSVPDLIQQSIPELAKMLGNDPNAAQRFARIITTDCRRNPELFNCTPLSFMGAMFTAAELKLEPVAGRAYLLPFKNSKKQLDGTWKKIPEVQFILGYKGIVDLFYRHNNSQTLSWGVVCENDDFDYEKGSNSFLKHKEALGNRGEKIAYWVGAYVNDRFLFEVMSHDDCISHGKKHSKTYDRKSDSFYPNSPWVTSEDSMCLKTVLIQLSKTLPMSVEMQKAMDADESTRYIHPKDFQSGKLLKALEAPNETNWEDKEQNEATNM